MATQPWILWIDADEVMTDEFVEELKRIFSDPDSLSHSGFSVNRLMRFENQWIRHGDWFPDHVMRLFRSDSWAMQEKQVHESIEIDGTTGFVKTPLLHYSYRNRQDRERRIESYVQLWAQQEMNLGRKVARGTPTLRAAWKLFRGLVLKGGFLDGKIGVWIAWSNAVEVYRKYALLRGILSEKRDIKVREG